MLHFDLTCPVGSIRFSRGLVHFHEPRGGALRALPEHLLARDRRGLMAGARACPVLPPETESTEVISAIGAVHGCGHILALNTPYRFPRGSVGGHRREAEG